MAVTRAIKALKAGTVESRTFAELREPTHPDPFRDRVRQSGDRWSVPHVVQTTCVDVVLAALPGRWETLANDDGTGADDH